MKTVLGIIIIILAAAAIFFYVKKEPVNNGSNNTNNNNSQNQSQQLRYKNDQYGFTIDLQPDWQGYTVLNQTWQGTDVATGKVTQTGPKIVLRHPTAHYEDIPVMVFTPAQWNLVTNEKLSVSAAPIAPSKLDSNSKYVFALPARYNYDYATGWEEADQIVHTLKAFDVAMKTYSNAQYGFQFEYPADMVVKQEGASRLGSNGVVYSIAYPDSKWSYSVDVETNSTNETLQQAFTDNYNYMKQMVTSDNLDFQLKDYFTSDVKVDGVAAKELYIDHFSDVGSTMASVIANGNVYLISGGVSKGDLDPFLSTFKFIK